MARGFIKVTRAFEWQFGEPKAECHDIHSINSMRHGEDGFEAEGRAD